MFIMETRKNVLLIPPLNWNYDFFLLLTYFIRVNIHVPVVPRQQVLKKKKKKKKKRKKKVTKSKILQVIH